MVFCVFHPAASSDLPLVLCAAGARSWSGKHFIALLHFIYHLNYFIAVDIVVLISSLAWPTQENSTPLIDALAVRKDLFYKVIYFIYLKIIIYLCTFKYFLCE